MHRNKYLMTMKYRVARSFTPAVTYASSAPHEVCSVICARGNGGYYQPTDASLRRLASARTGGHGGRTWL